MASAQTIILALHPPPHVRRPASPRSVAQLLELRVRAISPIYVKTTVVLARPACHHVLMKISE